MSFPYIKSKKYLPRLCSSVPAKWVHTVRLDRLLFADSMVLLAKIEDKLQQYLEIYVKKMRKLNIEINIR